MAENEDRVPFEPNPLWVTGTVETNGTGGNETTESVTPFTQKFRAEALARAAADPSADTVILPGDNGELDDDEAKRRLSDAAEEAAEAVELDVDKAGAQDDVADQVLSADKASAEANGGEAVPTPADVNPQAKETDLTSTTKAEVDKLSARGRNAKK